MENNEKRIPFDWGKYQSGEFEAICRDGSIPEQIVFYSKSLESMKITALVNNCIETFTEDGFWKKSKDESECDLFLIPKKKKFQAFMNLYSNGHFYDYESKDLSKQMNDYYESQGMKLIETRLIEWEG